jgi:flagellar biosynthesis/type III secretory pathway M-ring protein FliF/YscJ
VSILAIDWPGLQFIGQVLGFVAAIIAIAVATHKITKKITSLTSALDKKVAVLEEKANNIKNQGDKSEKDLKSHLDKVEDRITYMERLKMADSSPETAKDLLRKMGGGE